jgi:AP-2 complex subunit alpha
MATLALYQNCLEQIKTHLEVIFSLVKDKDISVRRRALDVLYNMCDSTNAKAIVNELLQYLKVAEFAIREEMVLKIAILTEKFATEPTWYVDVILQLIASAGDNVSHEVRQ